MPMSANKVQNWARGRAEMCHVFPALLSSLAVIWLALNQSSDPRIVQLSSEDPDSVETGVDALNGEAPTEFGLRLRCGFDRVAALTTLGYPDVVRQALRGLLEPVASSHPSLLLTALAHVWPQLLSPTTNGGSTDVMWLLSSTPVGEFNWVSLVPQFKLYLLPHWSSLGLPLTIRQCALVSLISGIQWGFQEIGNGSGRYVGVSNLAINEEIEKPIPLLKTSLALKTLRILLRSPPASTALAYIVDLPNIETVAASPADVTVPAQMIQSPLLHFLYAWIVTTGGIGVFPLSGVQDFLREVVPLTSLSAAISSASGPGAAITAPVSVFLLVKIFNEIIVTLANKDEVNDQKDIQDICQRLMESTASVAGTALEQAAWFRRGLQVRLNATTTPVPLISSTMDMSSSVGNLRASDLTLHPTTSESALTEVKLNGLNTPPGILQGSNEVVSTAG